MTLSHILLYDVVTNKVKTSIVRSHTYSSTRRKVRAIYGLSLFVVDV